MKKVDFASFHTFCHRCGTHLTKRAENLLTCENSHRIYVNPKITNAVIFENEHGHILLVKRKFPPHEGMWDLPGGFVDLHENMEASAIREIREELGVGIDELRYVSSSHDYYEYDGAIHPTICVTYASRISSQTPIQLTDDVSGYSFFPKNLLPYADIGFASMRNIIKEYVSQ